MTNDRHTLDEIKRDQDAAATMTATCPYCGSDCKVRAQHHQATRARPCQFLGHEGFCVKCQLSGIPIDPSVERLF